MNGILRDKRVCKSNQKEKVSCIAFLLGKKGHLTDVVYFYFMMPYQVQYLCSIDCMLNDYE
jgi:hypothetical protein